MTGRGAGTGVSRLKVDSILGSSSDESESTNARRRPRNGGKIPPVNADVPAKNTAELVAHAKANPGKLTYSSSGVGNPQHLNGELFAKMAGIDIVHVPYKGAAQQLTDVTSKQVTMTFTSLAAAQPFIKSGQIKPIAVTASKRVASMPNVPAVAESSRSQATN